MGQGKCSFKPYSGAYVYIHVSPLTLPPPPPPLKVVKRKGKKIKKQNKDSSHNNLRLSASIIVFCSRKLTSFLSELFMPIPRTVKSFARPKEKVKS